MRTPNPAKQAVGIKRCEVTLARQLRLTLSEDSRGRRLSRCIRFPLSPQAIDRHNQETLVILVDEDYDADIPTTRSRAPTSLRKRTADPELAEFHRREFGRGRSN